MDEDFLVFFLLIFGPKLSPDPSEVGVGGVIGPIDPIEPGV